MKVFRLFTWILLFTNCYILSTVISNVIGVKYKASDPAFVPYVDAFYDLLEKNCPTHLYNTGKFYTIEFVKRSKKDHWIAYCIPRLNGYYIAVDRNIWDNELIEPEKRQLLYHELSHCVILQPHVKNEKDYMNPEFISLPYEKLMSQVTRNMVNYCGSK